MSKREHETDADVEPAVKKINVAADQGDGPIPEEVSVRVMVPYTVSGAIIGKKGDALRQMKAATHCQLKMSRNEEGMYPGTHERVMLLRGKIGDVHKGLCAVIAKISEKIDSSHPTDMFDHKGVPRQNEMKFVVPNTSAGMVIGKNGSRIKEIREQTGANIQVFPKAGSADAVRSQERVISVASQSIGELEAACLKIIEKIATDPNHTSGPDSFVVPAGGQSSGPQQQQPQFDMYSAPPPMGGGAPQMQFAPPPQGPPVSLFAQMGRPSSPSGHHRQAVVTAATAGYDKSNGGFGMAPSIKFNPMEGIGNLEVMQFLDSLQTTLRTSGFTEQAVTEVMSAMQVLCKYNIMGLGLGLGVAAMAQMRGGAGGAQDGNLTNIYGSAGAPPGGNPSSDSMSTLMQSSGWASSATQQPQQYLQSSSPGITNQQSGNNNNSSPQSSGKIANFAASVIKPRMQMEPNKMELEIPDLIVMAVLAPGSKRITDIKAFTGVNVDTGKRSTTDSSIRVVLLQGDQNGLSAARLMIERAINEEHARRQQQAARQQSQPY